MHRIKLELVALLGVIVTSGVLQATGMEISTYGTLEAVNGTDVKLKCTFKSTHPVGPAGVTVSWNFRPLIPGPEESVFYYQDEPYPPVSGRFKGHAVWSGDIMKNDASITLREVPPTFNGTYVCQVRNMPDVHGQNGETILTVIDKVTLSEIGILGIAVGVACGVMLLILISVVMVKHYRKKGAENDIERHVKEPTVW